MLTQTYTANDATGFSEATDSENIHALNISENDNVEDLNPDEEDEPALEFNITTYGLDFAVEDVVRRIAREQILIPDFQRKYVWTVKEASRLIESLLMGLPIPGIFLSYNEEKKYVVIDGQQRLMTLYYFMGEEVKTEASPLNSKMMSFKLSGVHADYNGRKFSELEETTKNTLRESLIHASIVKQDSPSNDDTSIYYIFERLNNGGQKLYPQEIRSAIYSGTLVDLLRELNAYPSWRKIYGKESIRQKDIEAILRCLAFSDVLSEYQKPLKDFLNKYQKKNARTSSEELRHKKAKFEAACDIVVSIADKAFRFGNAINLAFLDAFMVHVMNNLSKKTNEEFALDYNKAKSDPKFVAWCKDATSDDNNVRSRFGYFKNV